MSNLTSFIQLKNFSKYLDSNYWILAYETLSQNTLYIRPLYMSRGKLYYNCIGQGWLDPESHPSDRPFSDNYLLNHVKNMYLMDIKIFQPLDIFTTDEILDFLKDVPVTEDGV